MSGNSEHEHEQEDGKLGVLLYYKYTQPIEDLNKLYNFYESNCSSLGLLGRVRLATQGVNVTIGGRLSFLKKHIEAVKENILFEGTDFKLAACDGPLENYRVAKECGFISLSIRIVKELVTLSANPLSKSPAIANAGRHLAAVEFHSVLQGRLLEGEFSIEDNRLVLVDARNLYETRIGKFETPHVDTLDPAIRQYSDLPAWIDCNVEQLRNTCVLMYCTGGIRCEMASAYIRSKGAGFENVFQLYGGIQRYLEEFPDGGFFKGKNFVFDHRIAVGPSSGNIIGKCLLCSSSYDDYSPRCRCNSCRMLVLVCDSCQKESAQYMCELCWRNSKGAESVRCSLDVRSEVITDIRPVSTYQKAALPLIQENGQKSGSPDVGPLRKLRILCLHGFRQNASSFKGRTASIAKKLKGIAELVFVNAPHELPFIYQSNDGRENCTSSSPQWLNTSSKNCSIKYAWLVAPDYYEKKASDWERIDTPFNPLQYQQQTVGFDESLAYLKKIFSQEGPFDGILGFSQGAAMTALICSQRGRREVGIDLSFAILCSGFSVNLASCGEGSIHCPSLHVYGKYVGKDRQIASQCSRHLASLFDDGCRVIIEHDSGHIIPTRSPYIEEVRNFLRRFR